MVGEVSERPTWINVQVAGHLNDFQVSVRVHITLTVCVVTEESEELDPLAAGTLGLLQDLMKLMPDLLHSSVS